MSGVTELFAFVRERHAVYERRARGLKKPWTDDAILRMFRFCNVYRELDTVTAWLRSRWFARLDEDAWFASVVARHVNNVPTLEELPCPTVAPLRWDASLDGGKTGRERFLEVTADRKRRGLRVFGAAYMISTNGNPAPDKAAWLIENVFDRLWRQRETLRPRKGDTLTSYHVTLGQMYGLASFLTAQVIADVKYCDGSPLREASDWWTFAASGPGSRRGLNRVLRRPADASWREDDWRTALTRLREELLPMFVGVGMPVPHAQDVQNCLCEFDKYERFRLGEGRPKQRYPGV